MADCFVETLHIPTIDLRAERAKVAYLHLKRTWLGFALAVLPYLEPATALHVHRYAGMTFLGLIAGIGQHTFGYGIVLEDLRVRSEHPYHPIPRLAEVLRSDPDLLYS